jgi:hypothetical protein
MELGIKLDIPIGKRELLGGSATINDFRTSISGGSETTQFLISGNYRTEGTVLPGDFRYIKGGDS